jgi:ornithine cyclodeaminase/alanine dehydrogenase-like protein (mu-crystallin family)
MELTLDALEESYRGLATGDTVCRPRIDVQIPTNNPARTYQWGTMEGGSRTAGYFGIRLKSDVLYQTEYAGALTNEKYAVHPGLFCGLILLFAVDNAEPLAIINDGYLQHFRVGADAGIGAKYMAREEARVVGMYGSGGMARSYLEALVQVRKIERVQVYSPTPEHRAAYAREVAERYEIEAVALEDPQAVCAGADIVCACTDSARPVTRGEWLAAGTHVMDVGGGLGPDVYARVERSLRLGTTPAPVGHPEWQARGNITYAARGVPGASSADAVEGSSAGQERLPRERVVMLEDLIAGRQPGRTDPAQITHSTRGNAQGAQFFSVGGAVYEAARQQGLGRELPTEWFLQDIRD